jgi:dTDP-L-rhamnose 4-epimerase
MMKVLITGGAGFIGSHTADALLAKGYAVRALDCLDPQIHGADRNRPAYLDPRVELQIGDVRNRSDVEKALDGVEAIYHFAAQTGVGQSMYDIHSYSDHIINGTAMLLDVLANTRHSVQRIILSSSRAVYGEGSFHCPECGVVYPETRTREQLERHQWGVHCPNCGRELSAIPTSEDKPQRPISVYALAKQVQEQLLVMFSRTYGVPAVILRYFNVYGTRQAINNPYTGIGAIFTNRALAGQDIAIYEDGRPGRDFVNVRDVVQANLLALENELAAGGTFNIGTGECLTVLDLAELIRKTIGSAAKIKFTNQFRLGDIRDCYADLTRSRETLGYDPKISFEEGVRELISWARGEAIEDRFAEAEDALRNKRLM